MGKQSTDVFEGSETFLQLCIVININIYIYSETLMGDTCHCTFVQTHRIYKTKSKP